jgi:subtilase family serine protease
VAGGGGGVSSFSPRPPWQPDAANRRIPDIAAFADPLPGYPIFCTPPMQDCTAPSGEALVFVGGTSAAAPLVTGMIALWTQAAKRRGATRPGFIPPLLYSLASRQPAAFLDVTVGTNSLFGGPCCAAGPGFDDASGLGSPRADVIAKLLPRKRR